MFEGMVHIPSTRVAHTYVMIRRYCGNGLEEDFHQIKTNIPQ